MHTKTRTALRRRQYQGGNELIEFALMAVVLLPLLLLTFVTGMNLIRGNQITHLARDLGSLYIHGLDFSVSANKDLAVRLARGLNLVNSSSSGEGVIILSQMTYIGDATCAANALSGSACTNRNQYVFTQRLTIGNTTLRTSDFGAPTTTINAGGYVQNFLTNAGARVNSSFAGLWNPALVDGQYVYCTEVFFQGADLGLTNLGNGGTYTRTFF